MGGDAGEIAFQGFFTLALLGLFGRKDAPRASGPDGFHPDGIV